MRNRKTENPAFEIPAATRRGRYAARCALSEQPVYVQDEWGDYPLQKFAVAWTTEADFLAVNQEAKAAKARAKAYMQAVRYCDEGGVIERVIFPLTVKAGWDLPSSVAVASFHAQKRKWASGGAAALDSFRIGSLS